MAVDDIVRGGVWRGVEKCFSARLPPKCRLERDVPVDVLVGLNEGRRKISPKKVAGDKVFQRQLWLM